MKNKNPTTLKLFEHMQMAENHFSNVWNELDKIENLSSNNIHMHLEERYKICSDWLYSLYGWQKYKQLYEFDKNLLKQLLEAEDISTIPTETIKLAPYQSFYIKFPKHCINLSEPLQGFLEGAIINILENKILITAFYEANFQSMFIGIKTEQNCTLKESLELLQKTEPLAQHIDFANIILKLVLYICSVNADIQKDIKHESIKKNIINKKKAIPQNKNYEKWNVGVRYGNTIRQSDSNSTSQTKSHTGSTSPKKAHFRRGHYHHFWTGKRDSNERQLIVKWIPPTAIGMCYDDSIPTIHKVKK